MSVCDDPPGPVLLPGLFATAAAAAAALVLGDDDLLCSPLSSAGNAVVVPPPPVPRTSHEERKHSCLSIPDGGGGRSYSCVVMGFGDQQTAMRLYELQDMWASAAAQLHVSTVSPLALKVMLFDDSKFYISSSIKTILVCDFPSSSISAMELPNGVENDRTQSFMLSRRDGSGIYLTHVKEFLLCIFHGDNAGNWFLVHSICLREVCTNLGIADCPSLDGHTHGVKIHAVGDNAKFVILDMLGTIVFLDSRSKQADKVYEMTREDLVLVNVHPLMLIWPPVFPKLKEGYGQQD